MNEGCLPGMLNLDEPDPTLKDTVPLLFDDEAINYRQSPECWSIDEPRVRTCRWRCSGHSCGCFLSSIIGAGTEDVLRKRDVREREHRIWSQQVPSRGTQSL